MNIPKTAKDFSLVQAEASRYNEIAGDQDSESGP